MILGIALVVHEFQKGPRVAYRYPTKDSELDCHRLFSASECTESRISAEAAICNLHQRYYNLDDENFAKLFRKPPVNKIFEIALGDVELISYASVCPKLEIEGNPAHQLSMFTLVFAVATSSFFRRINASLAVKCGTTSFSVENPMIVANSLHGSNQLLCKTSIQRVLEVTTNAISYEEKRSRYLTTQVTEMLKLSENRQHQDLSLSDTDTLTLGRHCPDNSYLCLTYIRSGA